MNNEATNQLTDEPAEGGTWLLDLVAAVDYLRRGIRPDITVWDALDVTFPPFGGRVGYAAMPSPRR